MSKQLVMNFSWEHTRFDDHFDKDTWEFVFPGNYRQKVYSQLVTQNNVVVGLNRQLIPAALKAQAIAYVLWKR